MKYSVKIISIKTIDEIEGSWNNDDFIELLKRFDYADADILKPTELKEYLFMAIADFDTIEAASIVLEYKLADVLTEGQIDNLSHEMEREKVSENYSDIFIHKVLFTVNQLLYKAYNGKFPCAKANVVTFEMKEENGETSELTKEMVLQAFSAVLSERNLINRLFKEQLEGSAPFPEAEGIIWDMEDKGNCQYVMTTSEKWLKEEELEKPEFKCTVTPYIEKSEKA